MIGNTVPTGAKNSISSNQTVSSKKPNKDDGNNVKNAVEILASKNTKIKIDSKRSGC